MRRRLRSYCLLLFGIGLIVTLLGAFGALPDWAAYPFNARDGLRSNPRSAIGVGLTLQAMGVSGYLAIAALWRRKS